MKKINVSVLCLILSILLLLSGCSNFSETIEIPDVSSEVSSLDEKDLYDINPLTGLYTLEKGGKDTRPVAVMINNITVAQSVQTGLNSADIVYETYVEGSITRLLAVFKDISEAPTLGSVRSARVTYVDLANGHNAVYVHGGVDPDYCMPYMQKLKTDRMDINSSQAKYGQRMRNGLSSEHTLFTSGSLLSQGLDDLKIKQTTTKTENWQNFTDPKSPITPADGVANSIYVPMSKNNPTTFKYDSKTGKYTRNIKSGLQKDNITGNTFSFKNIVVLFTDIVTLSDGKHVKSVLSSGSGYYASNGGYQKIKWSKGDSSSSFKFTDESGNPLEYNAGNSWVFIANKNISANVSFSES